MAAVTITTDYQVYAGEQFNYTGDPFFIQEVSPTPSPNLMINGSVNATGPGSIIGITIGDSGFYESVVTVGPTGVLNISAGGDATGFASGSWSPDYVNQGVTTVTGQHSALGLATWDAGPFLFDNSGAFHVSSPGDARGITLANAGTVHNSGDFEVTGGGASVAIAVNGFNGDFLNTGTIVAFHTGGTPSVGVIWDSTIPVDKAWVNDGTIIADIALQVSPYVPENAAQVFTNNGTMTGSISLGSGAGQLVNNHVINGDVDLGLGNDVYDGHLGVLNGVLHGGDGDDSIMGGAGADTLSGDGGADTVSGGAGDDLIDGGRDSDVLDGGAGRDTLDYSGATMGVKLDLGAHTAVSSGNDTVTNFEVALGGGFADTLTGQAQGAEIHGGAGDDVIAGVGGSNYLRGDDGDDSLVGGTGFDDINGNKGDDTIDGGAGDNDPRGGDWLVGGQGNDLITSHTSANLLYGNLGNDTLVSGSGLDTMRGGQGDDSLVGGSGDDFVSGDRGNDTESGGAGADIFHTSQDAGIDRVLDFHQAEGDRVMLDPGTTFTVTQQGADTIIDLGGGNEMVLVGVQMSTLTPGWIFGS